MKCVSYITNKNGFLPVYLLSWFVVIFGLHPTRGPSVVFFFLENRLFFMPDGYLKFTEKEKKTAKIG